MCTCAFACVTIQTSVAGPCCAPCFWVVVRVLVVLLVVAAQNDLIRLSDATRQIRDCNVNRTKAGRPQSNRILPFCNAPIFSICLVCQSEWMKQTMRLQRHSRARTKCMDSMVHNHKTNQSKNKHTHNKDQQWRLVCCWIWTASWPK